MNLADAPDVLTVDEAAQLARIGRNAMYAAVQRGDVWGVRIGKSIRIPKSQLVKFLGLQSETPTLPAPTPLEVDRAVDHTTARTA